MNIIFPPLFYETNLAMGVQSTRTFDFVTLLWAGQLLLSFLLLAWTIYQLLLRKNKIPANMEAKVNQFSFFMSKILLQFAKPIRSILNRTNHWPLAFRNLEKANLCIKLEPLFLKSFIKQFPNLNLYSTICFLSLWLIFSLREFLFQSNSGTLFYLIIFTYALPPIIAYAAIFIIRLIYWLFQFRQIVGILSVKAGNMSCKKRTSSFALFFVLFLTMVAPFIIAAIVAIPQLFPLKAILFWIKIFLVG